MTSHTTNTRATARWLAASVIAAGIGSAIATGSALASADANNTVQQIGQQQGTGGAVSEPTSTPKKNSTLSNVLKKFGQTGDLIVGNMK
jgi:hypothetical protein